MRTRKSFLFILILLVLANAARVLYRHYHKPVPVPPGVRVVVHKVDEPQQTLRDFPVRPRGVHSIDEIRRLMAAMPGLYADIDVDSLHPVIVSGGFYAYSQYYRAGKMLWTKRPSWIAAGTLLFCDKNGHCIKSDCGNEVSLTPHDPVDEALEPLPDLTGEPEALPVLPQYLPPLTTGPIPLSVDGTPVDGPPPNGTVPPIFCCGGVNPPGSHTEVPEPSTWLLVVAGVLFLVYFRLRYRRQR